MIKGGFQGLDISDVDLTAASPSIPGGYAICAAADGKTMRVLTADGVVQCSVKKVSTSYVLGGVTGDGKILGITITSTDGITVSETTIPTPAPEEYLNDIVTISSATSSSPYTTQYDGIVTLEILASTAFSNTPVVRAATGATGSRSTVILSVPLEGFTGATLSCFVKKGTKLYGINFVTGVSLYFAPYKPVS